MVTVSSLVTPCCNVDENTVSDGVRLVAVVVSGGVRIANWGAVIIDVVFVEISGVAVVVVWMGVAFHGCCCCAEGWSGLAPSLGLWNDEATSTKAQPQQ